METPNEGRAALKSSCVRSAGPGYAVKGILESWAPRGTEQVRS